MSKPTGCAIFLLFSALLWAQFGASLQGTVADSSGAAVPNAKVTLTNTETNQKFTGSTSVEGFYRFTGLAPGTYSLAVEAPNFTRQVISVPVQAEQSQGTDVILKPGAVTETVNVNGAAPTLVQTENAQIGQEMTTREVESLPQFARDPYDLVRLTPNTTADMGRAGNGNSVLLPNSTGPGGSNFSIYQTENEVPVSANGQRVSNNDFLLDGVSVNSLGWGGAAVVTPNQESVKQMLVLTNAYSAEWGRNSGAQISVISKNGTDDLHGSGFFKYDSPGLNSYNRWGGPGNAPAVRDNNLYRQFGASLGGPIVHNKLFWFASYEGLRQSSTAFSNEWIPTQQFLQSVIAARPNGVTTQIFQSKGIAPRVGTALNAPCPSGFAPGTCQQVAGGLDIGSLQGQTGAYTNTNGAGSGLDGVPDIQFAQVADPSQVSGNQYNGRIDYNLSTNNFVAVSTYFTHLYQLSADPSTGSSPISDVNFTPLNSAVTAAYIHVFSPTLVNEARANFTRFAANQVASNAGVVNWGVPRLEVQGFPFGRIEIGPPWSTSTPGLFAQNTFEFRDIVSKMQSNHGLKFGVEIRREQDNNNQIGGARPDYTFQGMWDLANGAPVYEGIDINPATGGVPNAERGIRTPYYGLFVQDDWKVRPNLTLNLGMRWEYFSPPNEVNGTPSNLYFGSELLANSTVRPTGQFYRPAYHDFAPRFGFAWSPLPGNRDLVVRGGFGIFYDRIPEALFGNATMNPPYFASLGICCGNAGNPFVGGQILYGLGTSNLPTSYPINPLLATGINPATGGLNGPNAAVEIYGAPQYMPNPMVYVYSLDIEYRLPWNMAADVGYSGSEGHHLIRLVNQNYLYPNNPAWNAVYFTMPDDNSNYNAALLTLRRPMAQGIQLLFNYRFSKSLDNSSFEGPGFVTNQTWPQNNRLNWGPSDYDVSHLVTISAVWDIPTHFKPHSLLARLLGGWEMDPIEQWHSGFPWTPVIGQSVQTPGGPSLGPIRPTVYYGGAGDNQSINAFKTGSNFPKGGTAYFDTTSVGAPGIGRNAFRGPRFWQTDLSFAKNTQLPWFKENSTLQLRANFFNIFNQLNLTPLQFNDQGTQAGNPFFGIANSGLAGRIVELQARFVF